MSKLKVPHDQYGNHAPFIGNPVLVDDYVFKATLKFVGIDAGRTLTTIVWEDTVSKKQYHSYIYLLQAILQCQMNDEAEEISFNKAGLFITARFGFEQRGNHVLLEVFGPEPLSADKEMALNYAKGVFEGVLDGKYNLRTVKTEARAFLKYLIKGKEADK